MTDAASFCAEKSTRRFYTIDALRKHRCHVFSAGAPASLRPRISDFWSGQSDQAVSGCDSRVTKTCWRPRLVALLANLSTFKAIDGVLTRHRRRSSRTSRSSRIDPAASILGRCRKPPGLLINCVRRCGQEARALLCDRCEPSSALLIP